MKNNKNNKEEKPCWRAIPCHYDNYSKEPNDVYSEDIFGRLPDFESPHWLYRRFHSNYCKALTMAKLSQYELTSHPELSPIV